MKAFFKPLLVLWPGSTGAIRYGLWRHLGIAILFGLVCQIALFLNFYWINFLSRFGRFCVATAVLAAWLILSAIASSSIKKYEKMRNEDAGGEAFLEAQTHYLRGNWFETECCIKSVLKKNPYDVEALLLRATLFRHLKRFDEARRTLVELERIDASAIWQEEILLEKKMIQEDEEEEKEEARAKKEKPEARTDVQEDDMGQKAPD